MEKIIKVAEATQKKAKWRAEGPMFPHKTTSLMTREYSINGLNYYR